MKSSERPPDSSTFASLWEPLNVALEEDDDDDGLPAALAGSRKGRSLPEDRETLLPPVPPGEYVRAMMALGELDDPLGVDEPAQRPNAPGLAARPLGLVLAAEHEMLLEEDAPGDEASRTTPVEPAPDTRPWADHEGYAQALGSPQRGAVVPRPGRREATVEAQRALKPRSTSSFPAVQARLPIPRAPSIPPEPMTAQAAGADALESLDSLEDLGSLDTLDGLGSLETLAGLGSLDSLDSLRGAQIAAVRSPAPPSSVKTVRPPPSSQQRPTPSSRPPTSAGLRLRTKTLVGEDDRGSPPSSGDAPTALTPTSDPAPTSLPHRADEMTALFEAGNYSSALVLAESVLASSPDHAEARRCAESCRQMLGKKYLTRLGGRDNIPRVIMSAEEMRVLSLDHRAGFLLSFVDGSMSIDEVLDVSSMPELDALRMMFELRMEGVIEIVEPNRRPGRR